MVESESHIWTEKYRPQSLDEIEGQENIVSSLKNYVEQGDIPNLLFSGPAGVGKTASSVAIARELYGNEWKDNFLELNASDERGIDIIRDRVKRFARASASNVNFRIIFLDEADALTSDAQSALRRTMETFSENVRFILSCNYPSQIIEAIQSRCSRYRFTRLSNSAVEANIREISNAESINITDGGIDALIYVADGDMRQAISGLRSSSVMSDEVTEETVYSVTGTLKPEQVEDILMSALSGEFEESTDKIHSIMNETGVTANEFLEQLNRQIWDDDLDIDSETAVEVSDLLGEIDYRISQGANSQIQINSLLSKITSLDE